MTVTRIRLIGNYFNVGINDYLEVAENVVVPLNFGVSDIRDLTSKTGSFSKSIKIAGTKHNNQVFDNIFDVNNVTLDFNINTKQQCLIEQDGEVVLDNAIMQLIDVQKISTGMGNDEQIEYTITVKDTVSELFTDIGNKLLTDLDFSDLNHTYQASDVIASFDHDKEDGYKYVLPIADDAQYDLSEMKPAVYVWQYLNRIFSNAGYSYQFDEMVQIGFDRLLIPYNGGKSKISEAVQIEAEVIAEETTSQESTGLFIPINNTQIFDKLDVTTEIEDDNGYYNSTLSRYTNPFAVFAPMNLEYQCEIDYDLVFRNNEAGDVYLSGSIASKPMLAVLNTSGQSKGFAYCFANSVNPICYIDGSGNTVIDSTFSGYTDLPSGDTAISSGANSINVSCTGISIGEVLEIGALTQLSTPPQFLRVSDNQPADVEYIIQVNSIRVRIVPSGESLGFSFPVVMNDFIPANIKQSDFLKSLFTMFNLFVIPNPDNPKDIIIQTRDKYYDSGRTLDASNLLCKDLPQTLTFLPELTAKKITLTYSDDTDALNVGYKKNVNETYGQVEYTFDNEYIKNDEIKTVLFGASPFVNSPFGATVMAINGSEPKTLPRIVYDGGKLSCGYYQINDTPTQSLSVNEYPYVGHLSAPVNADKDFNFGTCDYYFENTYGVIPYNNLGNTYWRRTMAQINSGTLYSVYLNVNSFQIANLRLNDKIYLDRAYWIINKVIDYDANSNAPTKFELLSVDQETILSKFPTRRPVKPSKSDSGISVPIKNIIKTRYDSLTSDSSTGGVIVLGKGNQILGTVKNAIVIGDNQVIKKDGIYVDGNFQPIGSGGGAGVIERTYDELTILKSNNELIPGAFYKITDFQTIYDQPDYSDAYTPKGVVVTKIAPVDPIILLATSPNTFAKEVWRPSTPQHRLEYNFDWTTTEKMGFPAKGLITKCIDEFNNITGYDHTVVLFKRYESVSGSGVFNSFWDTGFGSDEVLTFGGIAFLNTLSKSPDALISLGFTGFVLPNNVFLDSADNNTLKSLSNNNTFGDNTNSNIFGSGTQSNTFGDNTQYNNFGNDIKSNTFGDGMTNNTFSNGTNNIDFTTATHIYQQYSCEIFKRQDSTYRLRYTDNSDELVVVAPTD